MNLLISNEKYQYSSNLGVRRSILLGLVLMCFQGRELNRFEKMNFHSPLSLFKSNHIQQSLSIIIGIWQHYWFNHQSLKDEIGIEREKRRCCDSVSLLFILQSTGIFLSEGKNYCKKKQKRKKCSLCWCCWVLWNDKITILYTENQSHCLVGRYFHRFDRRMGL